MNGSFSWSVEPSTERMSTLKQTDGHGLAGDPPLPQTAFVHDQRTRTRSSFAAWVV